jgi:hypothetical protein
MNSLNMNSSKKSNFKDISINIKLGFYYKIWHKNENNRIKKRINEHETQC